MPSIVLIGVNEWHGLRQRSRHLAHELSATHRVLYVNPGYYSLPGYVRDTLTRRRRRESLFGVRQVAASLYVADFPPLMPRGLAYPALGRSNYRLLAPLMRSTLRRLDMHAPILWLSLPPDRALIGRLGEQLTLYDRMDNYPRFFRNGARRRLVLEEEHMLMRCDIVLAASEGLRDDSLKHNENVYLVRNGVDIDRFQNTGPRETSGLSLTSGPRSPVIGYAGTLGPWLDVALLTRVARTFEEATLVLAGPVSTDLRELQRMPNVRLLGERHYDEMPSLVRQFDVCLIPFLLDALTHDVNPIKLYESLALGKPMVTTALPEVNQYREVCRVAQTHEQFVVAVGDALKETEISHGDLIERRRQVAEHNTWAGRAQQITDIIESHLT